MLDGSINVSGYDAIRKMCEIFYDFALTNKGVFDAMLWYNMYANEDTNNTLSNLFFRIFDILKTLGYNDDIINHFIRTYRAFLEGYALNCGGKVEILTQNKLMTIQIGEKTFKIDLIEQRKPKK